MADFYPEIDGSSVMNGEIVELSDGDFLDTVRLRTNAMPGFQNFMTPGLSTRNVTNLLSQMLPAKN